MRAVGIRELKDRPSEYVRLAAAGETVLVMDGPRFVAELRPPAAAREGPVRDARRADAEWPDRVDPPLVSSIHPPERPPLTRSRVCSPNSTKTGQTGELTGPGLGPRIKTRLGTTVTATRSSPG
jgi:antitoxin (DNA-binding transcriptional repressor) of toxin-antitoxin stability system